MSLDVPFTITPNHQQIEHISEHGNIMNSRSLRFSWIGWFVNVAAETQTQILVPSSRFISRITSIFVGVDGRPVFRPKTPNQSRCERRLIDAILRCHKTGRATSNLKKIKNCLVSEDLQSTMIADWNSGSCHHQELSSCRHTHLASVKKDAPM
jgi:hypothetical protein